MPRAENDNIHPEWEKNTVVCVLFASLDKNGPLEQIENISDMDVIRMIESPPTGSPNGKVVPMLYIAGSLIFAFALVASLAVIAASFAHYGAQMATALRTLSLDGIHEPAKRRGHSDLSLTPRLDRPALAPRRLAA